MKRLKKILLILIIFTITIINILTMAEQDIKVAINGIPLQFDVQPQIIDGRTMVPMRAIFESMGATVEWIPDRQEIVAEKNDIKISMKIGYTVIEQTIKNGDKTSYGIFDEYHYITLDVPPKIINGKTLVPVRAVAESLDTKINWDNSTYTVNIITNNINNSNDNVIMYAPNERIITINKSEVENYKKEGWFTYPVCTMYALDGRTTVIDTNEINDYKKVGWYTTSPITDIQLAKTAYNTLTSEVKFQETLTIYNIWAYEVVGCHQIEIEYSAKNNFGQTVRQFYCVTFNADTTDFYTKTETSATHRNSDFLGTDVRIISVDSIIK